MRKVERIVRFDPDLTEETSGKTGMRESESRSQLN